MSKWYTEGIHAVMAGNVNLLTDDVKVSLVKGTYYPLTGDSGFSATVAQYEVAGTAQSLTSKQVAVSAYGAGIDFDADDCTWNGLTADFRHVVIYSGDTLLGWIDLQAQSVENKDLTIKWETWEDDPFSGESGLTGEGLLRGVAN